MATLMTMVLSSLMAIQASGDPPDSKGEGKSGRPDIETFVQRVADVVDATDEQVAELEVIARKYKDAVESARAERKLVMEARGEELKSLREKMREARAAGDDAKMKELKGEIREILGGRSQQELMRQARKEITDLLTPEQRIKFEALMARMNGGGKGRATTPARAERRGGGAGIYRFIRSLAEEVRATEEQRRALLAIAADHVRAIKAAEAEQIIAREEGRQRLEALHQQLREARRSGDVKTARGLREQIEGIVGTPFRDIMRQTHDRIVDVLTEEQMPKFEAMRSELRKTAGERAAPLRGRSPAKGPRPERLPADPVDDAV